MIEKVISGGQTGIDRMGLEVAVSLGIPTGGTAPKGYWTEKGNDYSLREFGLLEHTSPSYIPRTIQNIMDSDITVVFGDTKSPGSLFTIAECKRQNKECIVNPSSLLLKGILRHLEVKTLNVAGNRASKLTREKLEEYKEVLTRTLEVLCQQK